MGAINATIAKLFTCFHLLTMLYSCCSLMRGQKLPHTDIDWHFGVDPDPFGQREVDGSLRYFVPQGIAAVLGLTTKFTDTGEADLKCFAAAYAS